MAKWAYRVWDNGEQDSAWNFLAKKYLETFNVNCIQKFSFNDKKVFPQMNSLPEFYQEVITGLAKSNRKTFPKDMEDVLGLPLWVSNHIKYQSTANKVTSLYLAIWHL